MGFKSDQFCRKVDENLHCPICHDVFDNPLTCKDGHTFCNGCIGKWLQGNKKCPADNRPLDKKELVRNLTVKGIVDNIEVFCNPISTQTTESRPAKRIKMENRQEVDKSDEDDESDEQSNCSWIGKLHELETHRKTCAFQLVTCPYKDCKQEMIRKDLEKHKETCKYKRVVCKECVSLVVECKLQEHLEKDCPNAMIPCPNNCSTDGEVTKIKRLFIHFHVLNKCEMTMIPCTFAEQGCSVRVERGKADDHLRDNISLHMTLLANENATLKKQLNKVEEKLDLCNSYTWAITDYPSEVKKHPTGCFLKSPVFWLCGNSWYMLLYPNGQKGSKDRVSISLYWNNEKKVEKSKVTVLFSISVWNRLTHLKDITHTKNAFTFHQDSGGYGWKMLNVQDSLSPAYCNPLNGTFIIVCSIQLKVY